MELGVVVQSLLALAFVLGLILLLTWLARRFRLGGMGAAGGRQRLAIVETRALDARRRLVLVRRDDVEHLLLVGQEGSVVIESAIGAEVGRRGANPFAVVEREA